MTPNPYTEDALVQRTTAEYLERELGWQSVYAYNKEDLGPDSLLGRSSDREVVLVRTLREQLQQLNPGLPGDAYDDAVRQLTAAAASKTLVAANRANHDLIRDGVTVTFRDFKDSRVRKRFRVIDFDNPDNNRFQAVRELWIRGDVYRRRADIMGFVNGLPLLFIECKNIHRSLRAAYEKNYSDYRDTIPHIFHHNAIVMFGNGERARIGSVTSEWEHFHEWKRLEEDEPGSVDMETLLKGVCNRRTLLDLLENFILFDDSSGETRKILARNHQYLGVNRAVEAVRNRVALERRLGVFWHTQGAGKSYSMVMFARKVHRRLGGNFTFLVLTDRKDLDTQIYKTFAGCGVVDNEGDPCRASSGDHLRRLLGEHKSHVFSLIQKFNEPVVEDEPYSARDDIIVVTDEAHRTQYGMLALNMRNALPRASYIGFTGTPLFKDDEITRKVFGDYVSTYDFLRAVQDNATVPLYYDSRGDKLGLAIGDLNERIAAKIEEFETDDLDIRERLEDDLKRDYHVVTAESRLDHIARDLVSHYSTAWGNGKAMLICIDKLTCVRMHGPIERYWAERIGELEKRRKRATDEQEAIHLQRQIDWMRETITAVMVSEDQGEVEKFRQWELDIVPHRKLIKDGIELPELIAAEKGSRYRRMSLDEAFKAPDHPFRIAIVCAMWLTGFDVPSLATLYLDKPLKEHTLMQAIARANRVHEGKTNGLIVDYCGILKHLRRALATFAGTTKGGSGVTVDPAKPHEELLSELAEAIRQVRDFLKEAGAPLDAVISETGFERIKAIVACKEAANESDRTRKRFGIMCREVFRRFKACVNAPGVNAHRADRDAINIVYASLRRDREQADISDIMRELQGIVDEAIEIRPGGKEDESGPYDMSAIDFERLRREFVRSEKKNTTVQSLKTVIEQRLQRLLTENPLRIDLQERYEEIVEEYNREKDGVTIERTFERLVDFVKDLDDEDGRAIREGLDEESLAVFDLLKKPDLTAADIKAIKRVAVELLRTLKAEKLKVHQWRDKEATRDAVKNEIRDFLWREETGLPTTAYSDVDVETKTAAVFRHVHYAYPRLPSPVYGDKAA